ncbi:MAG TPA: hypothetical protein VF341_00665 [Anaeromyxobacteraceae bacterium]
MRTPTAWHAALCLLAASCAEAPRRGVEQEAAAVCPEYRDLRCATPRECSMDRSRGCLVCVCAAPSAAVWPNGSLPSAVPPDQRTGK